MTGDEYGLIDGAIHCRQHYFNHYTHSSDFSAKQENQLPSASYSNSMPFSPTCIFNLDQQQAVYPQQQFDVFGSTGLYNTCNMPPTPNYSPPSSTSNSSSIKSNVLKQQNSESTVDSKQTTKGRPKKRKLAACGKADKPTSKSPTRQPGTKVKRHNSIDDLSSPDYKDFGNRLGKASIFVL